MTAPSQNTDKLLRIDIDDTETEYIDGNPTRMWEGEPFTGVAFEVMNGQVIEEVSYLDGTVHGSAQSWYPSGRLESVSEHKSNLHHGPFKTFYENGSLRSEGIFELGRAIWRKTWDEDGHLVSEEKIEDDPDELSRLGVMRRLFERLDTHD
jgi:antitoxin component YwqK of YwqJK toxin-antitoxin module